MKVLIVCSSTKNRISPFIEEQANMLKELGVDIAFFTIASKGINGYLSHYKLLKEKLNEFKPHIIHAHYGLSALLSNLQRSIPVVSTYHGSDINEKMPRFFSRFSMLLSAKNIFVSDKILQKGKIKRNSIVLPCGVDDTIFKPIDKIEARRLLSIPIYKKIVLFSSSFARPVKNAALAIAATNMLDGVELIELDGYGRDEVALLMNASDCCLMTSITEGSPQFIKEAMLCNRPIVSTDVGDVSNLFKKVKGCYITSRNIEECSQKLMIALELENSEGARMRIKELNLTSVEIASLLLNVYKKLV